MKIVNYIKGSFKEFKDNVTWPSWSELQQDTLIVAVVTVVLALFLYLVDTAFAKAIYNVYAFLR